MWCSSASPALAVEGWRARCHAEHVSQQGTAHPDLVRRRPHIRILLALWPVDCAMLARPLRLAVAAKLPGRSSVCLQRAFARSSDAWSSRSPPPSRRRWFGDGLTRMGGGGGGLPAKIECHIVHPTQRELFRAEPAAQRLLIAELPRSTELRFFVTIQLTLPHKSGAKCVYLMRFSPTESDRPTWPPPSSWACWRRFQFTDAIAMRGQAQA